MPYGMCMFMSSWSVWPRPHRQSWIAFISSVGFCVARSTVPGNARASERGTSDGKNSHAFFVYITPCIYYPGWGGYGNNIYIYMEKDLVPNQDYLRLIYEHLMSDAFNCKRGDYPFADANHYDNVMNHVDKTAAYIETALIVLSDKMSAKKEEIAKQIKRIEDATTPTPELLDEVLSDLYKSGIAF